MRRFLAGLAIGSLCAAGYAWAVTKERPAAMGKLLELLVATPANGTEVAVSVANADATGLTAGALYRVACNIAVRYRVCAAGVCDAVTTDNILPAGAVENLLLKDAGSNNGTNQTQMSFITEAGTGKCVVARRE